MGDEQAPSTIVDIPADSIWEMLASGDEVAEVGSDKGSGAATRESELCATLELALSRVQLTESNDFAFLEYGCDADIEEIARQMCSNDKDGGGELVLRDLVAHVERVGPLDSARTLRSRLQLIHTQWLRDRANAIRQAMIGVVSNARTIPESLNLTRIGTKTYVVGANAGRVGYGCPYCRCRAGMLPVDDLEFNITYTFGSSIDQDGYDSEGMVPPGPVRIWGAAYLIAGYIPHFQMLQFAAREAMDTPWGHYHGIPFNSFNHSHGWPSWCCNAIIPLECHVSPMRSLTIGGQEDVEFSPGVPEAQARIMSWVASVLMLSAHRAHQIALRPNPTMVLGAIEDYVVLSDADRRLVTRAALGTAGTMPEYWGPDVTDFMEKGHKNPGKSELNKRACCGFQCEHCGSDWEDKPSRRAFATAATFRDEDRKFDPLYESIRGLNNMVRLTETLDNPVYAWEIETATRRLALAARQELHEKLLLAHGLPLGRMRYIPSLDIVSPMDNANRPGPGSIPGFALGPFGPHNYLDRSGLKLCMPCPMPGVEDKQIASTAACFFMSVCSALSLKPSALKAWCETYDNPLAGTGRPLEHLHWLRKPIDGMSVLDAIAWLECVDAPLNMAMCVYSTNGSGTSNPNTRTVSLDAIPLRFVATGHPWLVWLPPAFTGLEAPEEVEVPDEPVGDAEPVVRKYKSNVASRMGTVTRHDAHWIAVRKLPSVGLPISGDSAHQHISRMTLDNLIADGPVRRHILAVLPKGSFQDMVTAWRFYNGLHEIEGPQVVVRGEVAIALPDGVDDGESSVDSYATEDLDDPNFHERANKFGALATMQAFRAEKATGAYWEVKDSADQLPKQQIVPLVGFADRMMNVQQMFQDLLDEEAGNREDVEASAVTWYLQAERNFRYRVAEAQRAMMWRTNARAGWETLEEETRAVIAGTEEAIWRNMNATLAGHLARVQNRGDWGFQRAGEWDQLEMRARDGLVEMEDLVWERNLGDFHAVRLRILHHVMVCADVILELIAREEATRHLMSEEAHTCFAVLEWKCNTEREPLLHESLEARTHQLMTEADAYEARRVPGPSWPRRERIRDRYIRLTRKLGITLVPGNTGYFICAPEGGIQVPMYSARGTEMMAEVLRANEFGALADCLLTSTAWQEHQATKLPDLVKIARSRAAWVLDALGLWADTEAPSPLDTPDRLRFFVGPMPPTTHGAHWCGCGSPAGDNLTIRDKLASKGFTTCNCPSGSGPFGGPLCWCYWRMWVLSGFRMRLIATTFSDTPMCADYIVAVRRPGWSAYVSTTKTGSPDLVGAEVVAGLSTGTGAFGVNPDEISPVETQGLRVASTVGPWPTQSAAHRLCPDPGLYVDVLCEESIVQGISSEPGPESSLVEAVIMRYEPARWAGDRRRLVAACLFRFCLLLAITWATVGHFQTKLDNMELRYDIVCAGLNVTTLTYGVDQPTYMGAPGVQPKIVIQEEAEGPTASVVGTAKSVLREARDVALRAAAIALWVLDEVLWALEEGLHWTKYGAKHLWHWMTWLFRLVGGWIRGKVSQIPDEYWEDTRDARAGYHRFTKRVWWWLEEQLGDAKGSLIDWVMGVRACAIVASFGVLNVILLIPLVCVLVLGAVGLCRSVIVAVNWALRGRLPLQWIRGDSYSMVKFILSTMQIPGRAKFLASMMLANNLDPKSALANIRSGVHREAAACNFSDADVWRFTADEFDALAIMLKPSGPGQITAYGKRSANKSIYKALHPEKFEWDGTSKDTVLDPAGERIPRPLDQVVPRRFVRGEKMCATPGCDQHRPTTPYKWPDGLCPKCYAAKKERPSDGAVTGYLAGLRDEGPLPLFCFHARDLVLPPLDVDLSRPATSLKWQTGGWFKDWTSKDHTTEFLHKPAGVCVGFLIAGVPPMVVMKTALSNLRAVASRCFRKVIDPIPGIWTCLAWGLRDVVLPGWGVEPVVRMELEDWLAKYPKGRKECIRSSHEQWTSEGCPLHTKLFRIKGMIKIEINAAADLKSVYPVSMEFDEIKPRWIQAMEEAILARIGPVTRPLTAQLKMAMPSCGPIFYASTSPKVLDIWYRDCKGKFTRASMGDYSMFDATYQTDTMLFAEKMWDQAIKYDDLAHTFWAGIQNIRQPKGKSIGTFAGFLLKLKYAAKTMNASGRGDTSALNALVNAFALAISICAVDHHTITSAVSSLMLARTLSRVRIAIVGDDSLVFYPTRTLYGKDWLDCGPLIDLAIATFGLKCEMSMTSDLEDVVFLACRPYPVMGEWYWGPTLGRRLYKHHCMLGTDKNPHAWLHGVATMERNCLGFVPVLGSMARQVCHLLRGGKRTELATEEYRFEWRERADVPMFPAQDTYDHVARVYSKRSTLTATDIMDVERRVERVVQLPFVLELDWALSDEL